MIYKVYQLGKHGEIQFFTLYDEVITDYRLEYKWFGFYWFQTSKGIKLLLKKPVSIIGLLGYVFLC